MPTLPQRRETALQTVVAGELLSSAKLGSCRVGPSGNVPRERALCRAGGAGAGSGREWEVS